MGKFSRLLRNWNLKYVLGEILLIFVGINLAIWFNNWNSSKQLRQDKVIVLNRIEEELQANLEELSVAMEVNALLAEGLREYEQVFEKDTDNAVATPRRMAELQSHYPNVFRIQDSVQVEEGIYQYTGQTYLNITLPELRAIAWKTAQSLEILNELEYECLFDLESLYNLQQQVLASYEKVTEALGSQSGTEQLVRRLIIAGQLDLQLSSDYETMLEMMDNCR